MKRKQISPWQVLVGTALLVLAAFVGILTFRKYHK
jgi:hypothetical protein